VRSLLHTLLLITLALYSTSLRAQDAEPWQDRYQGDDACGAHVLAFWSFDETEDPVKDVSGKGHDGTLDGATRSNNGRFGAGLESYPGWPVADQHHAVVVPDAPELSPPKAFTIEMWLCPKEWPPDYGEAFLLDKKYVAHTDYQLILEAPDKKGGRRIRVLLGFGGDSDTWWSPLPAALSPGTWSHVAVTYDGAGTVHFFQDGRSLGRDTRPGRAGIMPGDHALSLGDRIGSYYHGFPGLLDEIRITTGAREFRPVSVSPQYVRTAYRRMEPPPPLTFRVRNNTRQPIAGLTADVAVEGLPASAYPVPELAPGAHHDLTYNFDTALRPDAYTISVAFQFGEGEKVHRDREAFPVHIVPRNRPHRMPVIMWGIGGTEEVVNNLPALKDIGFTHCLGLRCDFSRIWDAAAPTQAVDDKGLAESRNMLDKALINDMGVIISLSPGSWLESKPELLQVDESGKPYDRPNICPNAPGVMSFVNNVGASVAQTYGGFPAFAAALLDTEIRDATQLCFHDHDRAAYRAASGKDYPAPAGTKNGLRLTDIPGFPENRVLPDDDDRLAFYRWFWREGDGWNRLHSAINDGLKSTARKDLWTFFDPAVRVPPLWGSGGNVNVLSHWTYSYPDPIRIGLAADELFAMARGGPEAQAVMKMTQIIWYRSQTAPAESAPPGAAQSPWEDRDPGADYITISPSHLKEAFWTKIARPITGIMYHGWQSLVPTGGHSAYRYTHPDTARALKSVVAGVVEPLGPTLLQIPEAPADVAFLESFTSCMFAGRGTYGWGGSWLADAYHVMQYAHLQPRVVYEETLLKWGLDGYKVLVMADCDVLPASVVEKVNAFQHAGGIIIGDDRLCPAITADILIDRYERTKHADADKAALLERAATLLAKLSPRYQAILRSSTPDVIPYRRRLGSSDYVFAVNDRREFGDYVGRHALVMEQGIDASAEFSIRRPQGCVYDLLEHRRIETHSAEGGVTWPVELEPGGGRIWLVTDTAIERLAIHASRDAARAADWPLQIAVTGSDDSGIDAVIPVEVRIADPDGRPAEGSGFYGAPAGKVDLTLTFAPNDTPGIWTIDAKELCTGMTARHFVRLSEK